MHEYSAMTCDGACVAWSADLAEVLRVLAASQGDDDGEDVVVWQRGRAVLVRHPDGSVTAPRPRLVAAGKDAERC